MYNSLQHFNERNGAVRDGRVCTINRKDKKYMAMIPDPEVHHQGESHSNNQRMIIMLSSLIV